MAQRKFKGYVYIGTAKRGDGLTYDVWESKDQFGYILVADGAYEFKYNHTRGEFLDVYQDENMTFDIEEPEWLKDISEVTYRGTLKGREARDAFSDFLDDNNSDDIEWEKED